MLFLRTSIHFCWHILTISVWFWTYKLSKAYFSAKITVHKLTDDGEEERSCNQMHLSRFCFSRWRVRNVRNLFCECKHKWYPSHKVSNSKIAIAGRFKLQTRALKSTRTLKQNRHRQIPPNIITAKYTARTSVTYRNRSPAWKSTRT